MLSPLIDFCATENLGAIISDATSIPNFIIPNNIVVDKSMLISAYISAPVNKVESISNYLKKGKTNDAFSI
jgi:hypothetical protein